MIPWGNLSLHPIKTKQQTRTKKINPSGSMHFLVEER
jgi:hypothetical protein